MNIFNIGKANARITELETELAAHKENQTAIEKQAETLQAEVKTAQAATAKALSDFAAENDRTTKAEADLKAAQAAQADFDAKVATAASAKALEITASLGVAPLKAPAPTVQADNVKTRAEFSAMNPADQSSFCLKGGKLTD